MVLSPRRHAFLSSLIVAAALGAGCATPPPPPPAPAPQVQPLAEYMSEAAKAKAERLTTKERDTYRAAARQYPTAKEPWMRLAESYFEAGDYGNAILAAQEVLQRDAADGVAASVLAVSGLRVSTQALSTLRTQNSTLPGDTRTQAEGLTKTLRELLGETVLVPQPADPPVVAAPPPPPPRRARPAAPAATPGATPVAGQAARPATTATVPAAPAAVKPTSAPAPATAAPATAPAPAKPPAPKNPFDVLK